jgi:hypothetical protein
MQGSIEGTKRDQSHNQDFTNLSTALKPGRSRERTDAQFFYHSVLRLAKA